MGKKLKKILSLFTIIGLILQLSLLSGLLIPTPVQAVTSVSGGGSIAIINGTGNYFLLSDLVLTSGASADFNSLTGITINFSGNIPGIELNFKTDGVSAISSGDVTIDLPTITPTSITIPVLTDSTSGDTVTVSGIQVKIATGTGEGIETLVVTTAGGQVVGENIQVDAISPAVPTGLVATPGDQKVDLVWQANTEPDLGGYKVKYGLTPDDYPNIIDVPAPANSKTISNLSNSILYYFVLSSYDLAGNESANSSFVTAMPVDTIAPITTLTTSPSLPNGENNWFKTLPTITLTPNEPGQTYYQWDSTSGIWILYSQPFVAPEGDRTLYYYSIDQASPPNQEEIRFQGIKVDINSPIGSVTINDGEEATKDPQVSLSISAYDLGASGIFEMMISQDESFDNDLWEDFTSSKLLDLGRKEGERKVYLKFKDKAGNQSEVTFDSIILDWTAPPVPTGFTLTPGDGKVTLSWDPMPQATEYVVRYRKEGGEGYSSILVVETGIEITRLDNNFSYEFGVASLDELGNQSEFAVDFATPGVFLPSPPEVSLAVAPTPAPIPLAPPAIGGREEEVVPAPIEEKKEEVKPEISPSPTPEEGKIKAGEEVPVTRNWTRLILSLAILVIAAGAGFGGYYGYQWWLKSRKPPLPPTEGRW